jgi:3-oxoacyl-(acyl-carrier-protein) synthase
MTSLYIRAIGINSERCQDKAELAANIGAVELPASVDRYSTPTVRLGADSLAAIGREDRSTLNELSTGVLNAVSDALRHTGTEWLGETENVAVFTGTDGAELTFNAIGSLIDRSGENAMDRLGELKSLTNPINMMRLLSTNSTYHVSKRFVAQGGGYPNQSMSLSGMCALEDACYTLRAGINERAVVVASGNMRSFDSMVVFGKLGLLDEICGQPQVDPAYGSAALVIDRAPAEEGPTPIAEVLAVHTQFAPDPVVTVQSWRNLFTLARERHGLPDLIVTYANGARQLEETETSARNEVFGSIPVRNYKRYFGYTGKANNLLDLAAALVDDSIQPGTTVLLCGAGFGFGIGYILVRKLGKPALQ